jgi:hypothetical protein
MSVLALWPGRRLVGFPRTLQISENNPNDSLDAVSSLVMQKWEYQIFASHLDPADLIVIMDRNGSEGWELVTVVPITDYQPLELIEPEVATEEPAEVVQLEAFRYIFKRPKG